jgi:5-hydroxyisourate hydrolase-like protein (transthyretin family)
MGPLRNLVWVILLSACTGCLTNVRPTVVGQVVDAKTGRPVPRVAVSVHFDMGSSHPSEALARATSRGDGTFTCPGFHSIQIWSGYLEAYQVRFHRDDYNDSVYDFEYEAKLGVFGDRMRIGQIVLHPRSPDDASKNLPPAIPTILN